MVVRRLRGAYHRATVPPDGVEKASRYERVRRNAWMVGSTFIAIILGFGVLFLVMAAIDLLAGVELSGTLAAVGVLVLWIVISAIIDLRLFSWGVDYFDLVPPWQFRAPEVTHEQE